jgi:hypothetical protein
LLTGLGAVGAGGHDHGLGDGERRSRPEIALSLRATSRTEQAIDRELGTSVRLRPEDNT